MSLEVKVTLRLLALLLVSFAVVTAIVAVMARRALREEAFRQLASTADSQAARIAVDLNDAMGAARALANSLQGAMADPERVSRSGALAAMEAILESNEFYFGVWAQFEPNGFDGCDATFQNAEGYAEDGSFMPYIVRENGDISVDPSTGNYAEYENEAYYTIPRETGREAVMEPYIEPDADNALMTSVCVPIFAGGRVVGVAGIDLLLDEFSRVVGEIKPFGDGYAFLLSQSGNFIGHPDKSKLSQAASENGISAAGLEAIPKGESILVEQADPETGETVHIQFSPVRVGTAPTPWSMAVAGREASMMRAANRMTVTVALIGLVALVLCGLFTYITVRAIATPIKHVVARLRDIAEGEGDLTRRIDIKRDDEIGQLALWFNTFVAKLQRIMRDVADNTTQLAQSADAMAQDAQAAETGAQEVLATAQQASSATTGASANLEDVAAGVAEVSHSIGAVAEGSGAVSSNLESVSAAVEEMSANMNTIAAAVEEMSSSVNTVASAVEEMSASLGEVSGNTRKAAVLSSSVSEKASATAETVSALQDASSQISRVVDLIRGIAAQTNLLALNATIEAATAGDAGKGFAVVAHEVKELARQTQAATEEIGAQVEHIQLSSRNSVAAINGISEGVVELNESFKVIASAVQEQTIAIHEITQNLGEAAKGAGEVSRNVQEAAAGATDISRNVSLASQSTTEIASRSGDVAGAANRVAGDSGEASHRMQDAASNVERISKSARSAETRAESMRASAQGLQGLANRLREIVGQFTV
jgi:methyl-accepting chemotaxis protein